MAKIDRQAVYDKYNGHCAYCGRAIEYKDMQVDHIIPKRNMDDKRKGTNDPENLSPACRRCNHYKRASTIEGFRYLLLTLHERIRQQYISKVAEDYGIITVASWDGTFYFEKKEDITMLDWDNAEQYLKVCEAAYAEIGTAGYFALNVVIRPLRDRFNAGERTTELYDEIMEIAL